MNPKTTAPGAAPENFRNPVHPPVRLLYCLSDRGRLKETNDLPLSLKGVVIKNFFWFWKLARAWGNGQADQWKPPK